MWNSHFFHKTKPHFLRKLHNYETLLLQMLGGTPLLNDINALVVSYTAFRNGSLQQLIDTKQKYLCTCLHISLRKWSSFLLHEVYGLQFSPIKRVIWSWRSYLQVCFRAPLWSAFSTAAAICIATNFEWCAAFLMSLFCKESNCVVCWLCSTST